MRKLLGLSVSLVMIEEISAYLNNKFVNNFIDYNVSNNI